MIDRTLINKLTEMAKKEKKIKEFKKRLRVKGKIVKKRKTKKGNITLQVKEKEEEFKFIVLKSHKESFALAEKLAVGKSVSVHGIPKFRMIICTKLKALDKGIDESKQKKLI
jgi:DNA polymerase II small subunit/DNA polymerase delta subunit B